MAQEGGVLSLGRDHLSVLEVDQLVRQRYEAGFVRILRERGKLKFDFT
jgi:hypothetical protein